MVVSTWTVHHTLFQFSLQCLIMCEVRREGASQSAHACWVSFLFVPTSLIITTREGSPSMDGLNAT